MKAIDRYILEKFQITKDSNYLSYQPKNETELRKILEERLAEDKDADLNDIDVSKIINMDIILSNGYHGLFFRLDPHNIKIDKWDVSNVKYMNYMFYGCKNFNSNLKDWDVSNVIDMYGMFMKCENFEGKGLENWTPIKCKYMDEMFVGCKNFNCDLNNWDVSNNPDMHGMFVGCDSLKNKPSWYKN